MSSYYAFSSAWLGTIISFVLIGVFVRVDTFCKSRYAMAMGPNADVPRRRRLGCILHLCLTLPGSIEYRSLYSSI
jgi:hypothetical protein